MNATVQADLFARAIADAQALDRERVGIDFIAETQQIRCWACVPGGHDVLLESFAPATVDVDGRVSFSASRLRALASFAKAARGEVTILFQPDKDMGLSDGSTVVRFRMGNTLDQMPTMSFEVGEKIRKAAIPLQDVTIEAWRRAVRPAMVTTSTDDTRPNLAGVSYDPARKQTWSTDGHRLTAVPADLGDSAFWLPRSIGRLDRLLRAPVVSFGHLVEQVDLPLRKGQTTPDKGEHIYYRGACGCIRWTATWKADSLTPIKPWRTIDSINRRPEQRRRYTVDRKTLLQAFAAAVPFAPTSRSCKLCGPADPVNGQPCVISVQTSSLDIGEGVVFTRRLTTQSATRGKEEAPEVAQPLGLNASYMMEALRLMPDVFVEVSVQGELEPALITGNDSKINVIVMPMRL